MSIELDVCDINRRKTGKVVTCKKELLEGEYFFSTHVWIVNSKGEFLIQKRSPNMWFMPNKWSVSGGHVDAGETSLECCLRETFEEVGIKAEPCDAKLLCSLEKPDINRSFVDVWVIKKDVPIEDVVIQKEEVSEAKWATLEEIKTLARKREFAENVLFALDDVVAEISKK